MVNVNTGTERTMDDWDHISNLLNEFGYTDDLDEESIELDESFDD